MEKQYIFFDTSKALWFSALCGRVVFFSIITLAISAKPAFWQVVLFVFIFSGAAIFAAFKIDSKKELTKSEK